MKLATLIGFVVLAAILGFSPTANAQNFWQATSTIPGVSLYNVNALAVGSGDVLFVATNDTGLYRSTDNGTTWGRLDAPPMKKYFGSLAVDPSGNVYAGSFGGTAYKSTDNGNTWQSVTIGTATSIITSFAFGSGSTIYVGTGLDGVFTSHDGGSTWGQAYVGHKGTNVFPMTIDPSGNIFVGTYGDGFYRSTDEGKTWDQEGLSGRRVNSLVIGSDGHTLAGTDFGLFRDSFRFDTLQQEPLIVDTVRVWHRLPDTAQTQADTAMRNLQISSLIATSGGHILVGTYGSGVYHSTDNGASWSQVNTGITRLQARTLAINSAGYVFCGTSNGSVFVSTQPEPNAPPVIPPKVTAPVALFRIEQNYPNPFNPSTTIPYSVSIRSYASIRIYNAVGQEVATILNGEVEVGDHVARWDASGFPSGVYYYRFQSPSYSQTGKLVLMK